MNSMNRKNSDPSIQWLFLRHPGLMKVQTRLFWRVQSLILGEAFQHFRTLNTIAIWWFSFHVVGILLMEEIRPTSSYGSLFHYYLQYRVLSIPGGCLGFLPSTVAPCCSSLLWGFWITLRLQMVPSLLQVPRINGRVRGFLRFFDLNHEKKTLTFLWILVV